MFHCVYYPFPKDSAIGANATVLRRFTDKYANSVNNTHDENSRNRPGAGLRYKGDLLGDIKNDDMLMISSHGGSTDPTTIISDKGQKEMFNTAERLTANDLAKQLAGAGLSDKHVLIKMLDCYAGGVLTQSGDGVVRSGMGGSGEDFFAKLLAVALRTDFQFSSILVGGYAGPLLNATVASKRATRPPMKDNNHLYNRVDVEGGSSVDAHDHIHWFDGSGNEVPRTAIRQLKLASDAKQGTFSAPTKHQLSKGITSVFKRT